MNIKKLKIYSFISFGICTTLLVLMALLGIWEVIDEDIAWKSILSLSVIGFATLFVFVIGEKLFEKK